MNPTLELNNIGLSTISPTEAKSIQGGSIGNWFIGQLIDFIVIEGLCSLSKASADRETTRPKGVLRCSPGL